MNITIAGTVNVDVMRVARHDIEQLCEAGDQEQLWFAFGSVFLAIALFFLAPLVVPGDLTPLWSASCHVGTLAFGVLFLMALVMWWRQRAKRIRRRDAMFKLD